MEEFNTIPNTDSMSSTPTEIEDTLSQGLNKSMSRRSFLKGLGTILAAGTLASCAPGLLEADSDEERAENVREFNRQFDLIHKGFLNPDASFNYDRYIQQYPGFESYSGLIENNAIDMARQYGVHPDASRALATAIVVSNMNSQDVINEGDKFRQRVGVMQFKPIHLIENVRIKSDPNLPSSVEGLKEPTANIKYGLQLLFEGLGEIRNNGDNRNIIELLVANYYGQKNLVDQVKWNREITQEHYLWSNYSKYVNTINILGLKIDNEGTYENLSMEQVWSKAVDNWPDTQLSLNKEIFFKEVNKYFNDEHNLRLNLTKEQYLALFIAIAATESNCGISKVNQTSGALGWYQLVPHWRHLEDFNDLHGTNYSYNQMVDNDAVSIEVGIWTLMRYRSYKNMTELMQMFKGGNYFGNYPDDYKWWNSVSEKTEYLLGKDELAMGRY